MAAIEEPASEWLDDSDRARADRAYAMLAEFVEQRILPTLREGTDDYEVLEEMTDACWRSRARWSAWFRVQ